MLKVRKKIKRRGERIKKIYSVKSGGNYEGADWNEWIERDKNEVGK